VEVCYLPPFIRRNNPYERAVFILPFVGLRCDRRGDSLESPSDGASVRMKTVDFILHSDPSATLAVGIIVVFSLLFMWFVIAVLD